MSNNRVRVVFGTKNESAKNGLEYRIAVMSMDKDPLDSVPSFIETDVILDRGEALIKAHDMEKEEGGATEYGVREFLFPEDVFADLVSVVEK